MKKLAPPVPPRPLLKSHSRTNETISTEDKIMKNSSTNNSSSQYVDPGRTVIYKSPSIDTKYLKNNENSKSPEKLATRIDKKSPNNLNTKSNVFSVKTDITKEFKNNNNKFYTDDSLHKFLIPHSTIKNSNKNTGSQCFVSQNKNDDTIIWEENINKNNNFNSKMYELKRNRTEIIIKVGKLDAKDKNENIPVIVSNDNESHLNNIKINNNNMIPVPKPRTLVPSIINRIKISKKDCNLLSSSSLIMNQRPTVQRSNTTLCGTTKRSSVFITNATTSPVEQLLSEMVVNNQNNFKNLDTKSKDREHANNNILSQYSVSLSKRPEPEGGCEVIENTEHIENSNKFDKFSLRKEKSFHEILISEIREMHDSKKVTTKGKENIEKVNNRSVIDIQPSISSDCRKEGVFKNDQKKNLSSSCYINLEDSGLEDETERSPEHSLVTQWENEKEVIKKSVKPPNQLSVSAYCDVENSVIDNNNKWSCVTPINKNTSKLDGQLDILRKEMFDLRQLDISLLTQLRTLNNSIQEFRTMLEDQDLLSPSSPSPSDEELSENEVPIVPSNQGTNKKQQRKSNPQHRPTYKSRPAPLPPPLQKRTN